MPKRNPDALSKRSRAAHNAEPVLPPVEPSPGQAPFEGMDEDADSAPEAAAATPAPQQPAPSQQPAKSTRASAPQGMQFVGLAVPQEWWNDARAAFVADFWDDEENAPGTFRAWVAQAVEQYVKRGSVKRIETAQADTQPKGRKLNREVAMPVRLVEQVEAARRDDARATRSSVSRSQFVAVAMHQASEATRARYGGTLDPAPAKLPTRGYTA